MDYSSVKLIRKRYYPNEEIDISCDEIVHIDERLMVTKWVPINDRTDIEKGTSYWFFDKNIKVSKIYEKDGNFKYYYIDMCRYETEYLKEYKMIDLLADIIVYPDGHYKVLDFDELLEYMENETITPKEFLQSIKAFTKTITDINEGVFPYQELEMYND